MTTDTRGSSVADKFIWTKTHTAALVTLCLAQLIESLDVTVVNVALPTMQADLGFSETGLLWVVNAYGVLFGGFLLLGGRSGDLLGKRRVFQAGVALFTVASIICGLATQAGAMTTGRAMQGLAAAFVSPMTLATIASVFPEGRARNKAFGIWGMTSGLSASAGVALGGILTDGPGWRWIFGINVPVGLLLLWAARTYLPSDRKVERNTTFDAVGAATCSAGVGALVYACTRSSGGWGINGPLVPLCIALALLVYFVLHERYLAKSPLVVLEVLHNRSVIGANTVAAFVGAAMISMFYFISLFEQQVLHYSPLKTGLSYLPLTAMLMACAFLAPVLIPRIGVRYVLLLGALIAGAGLVLFATAGADAGVWRAVILPSLVASPGLALTFIPMSVAAVSGVPENHMGFASGLTNVTRVLGGAIGLAVMATAAGSRTAELAANGVDPSIALAEGFSRGFIICAALMGCAGIAALTLPRRQAQ